MKETQKISPGVPVYKKKNLREREQRKINYQSKHSIYKPEKQGSAKTKLKGLRTEGKYKLMQKVCSKVNKSRYSCIKDTV